MKASNTWTVWDSRRIGFCVLSLLVAACVPPVLQLRALQPLARGIHERFLRPVFAPLLVAMGSKASHEAVPQTSVHEFTVQDASGNNVDLSTYKGKVLLIVNVASQCGLTQSNYKELTEVHNKYRDQGVEILAFPCNQFGGQEPGTNDQIKEFACTRFKAEFPIFDKINVNGVDTAPLYKFLKANKGGGILGDNIKWNFSKFLVDKDGKVVDRYAPTTSPSKIEGLVWLWRSLAGMSCLQRLLTQLFGDNSI